MKRTFAGRLIGASLLSMALAGSPAAQQPTARLGRSCAHGGAALDG